MSRNIIFVLMYHRHKLSDQALLHFASNDMRQCLCAVNSEGLKQELFWHSFGVAKECHEMLKITDALVGSRAEYFSNRSHVCHHLD
jgi:hypothetical protein